MATIRELLEAPEGWVGFYGYPPPEALRRAVERHGGRPLDLDVEYGARPVDVLPGTCCRVLDCIVRNAHALRARLRAIVCAAGPEKCDGGRFVAHLLRDAGFAEVVITAGGPPAPAPPGRRPILGVARGPLRQRVDRIMETIVRPLEPAEEAAWAARRAEPTHGFWGTPPQPIELLDLFPETTAIYGWTRCVELGAPADLELETAVDPEVPTVFFHQGFCAKAALARDLARRHRGLLVDVHDRLTGATIAKVEAFLKLSRRGPR
jgi:hypothetical protein